MVSVRRFQEHWRPDDANMLRGVQVDDVAVFEQGQELVAAVSATGQDVDVAVRSKLTEVEEGLT